jgi:hypothetical protein
VPRDGRESPRPIAPRTPSRAQRIQTNPAACLIHTKQRPPFKTTGDWALSHLGVRSTHAASVFEQTHALARPSGRARAVRTNPGVGSPQRAYARCAPRAFERTRPAPNKLGRRRPCDRDAPAWCTSERTQRPASPERTPRTRGHFDRAAIITNSKTNAPRARILVSQAGLSRRSPARPATSRFSRPAARSGVAERRSSSGRCRWHGSRRCQPGGHRRRRVRSDRPRPGSAPAGRRTWRR